MLYPIQYEQLKENNEANYNDIMFRASDTEHITYQDWAKHHQYIGVRSRTAYTDDEGVDHVASTKSDRLNDPENYGSVRETVYSKADDTLKTVNADYVIFSNQNYPKAIEQKPDIDHNTTVQLGIRLNFLLDDFLFHLDYRPRILGQYNILDFLEDLGEIIYDIADREDIERYGITVTEDSDEDDPEYDILGVRLQKTDDSLHPSYSFANINITEDELLEGFVGCEIYQYDIIESD